jgi:hypothetical protein
VMASLLRRGTALLGDTTMTMVHGGTIRARSAIFITSIITSKSNNRLRVTDAPGFYAAFPWGGFAQCKGATGTRSNAIGARALYSPLSPPFFLHLAVHSATVAIVRAVHRGPPLE